jgi:hypothetical protein
MRDISNIGSRLPQENLQKEHLLPRHSAPPPGGGKVLADTLLMASFVPARAIQTH